MRRSVAPIIGVLFCLYSLNEASSHEPKKLILCRDGYLAKWFHLAENRFENLEGSGYNCSMDYLSFLCRSVYGNVLHVERQNATLKVAATSVATEYVPGYDQPVKAEMKKKLVNFSKYKCLEYKPAPELKAPEGAWTDRLVATKYGKCESEGEWIERAEDHCRKELVKHAMGERCDDIFDRYVDITFVCDKERNKYHYHVVAPATTDFAVIEEYAKVAQEYEDAIRANDTDTGDRLFGRLVYLIKAVKQSNFSYTMDKQIEIEYRRMEIDFDGEFFSRDTIFETWKECVSNAVYRRYYDLINLALALVGNETSEADMFANRTIEYGLKHLDSMHCHAPIFLFPELRLQMEYFYLDYCKDHTPGIDPEHLGFLGEPDGHEKLVALYREIFSPGLASRRYLKKPPSEEHRPIYYAFSSALVVLVAVVGVLTAALFAVSRKVRDYHMDDKDILDMEAVPEGTVSM
ncbi:hypothetical protein L596_021888 [Steinernema carpocapsae]|uniref:E1 domain-containing protein n=1 Tax=Steinernema carpocapsae TaxID=34508 RepID=A0A4U5MKY0_STECR|nr:hypothetical protein L596_021888 [Steinernema carpocapsae]